MELDQFCQAFSYDSSVSTFPSPRRDFCEESGIAWEPRTADFYIPPSLELSLGDELSRPVILLSAPAAVGKTSLALELQRRLSSSERLVLYIPLQKSAIGDNFFSGLLAKLFPSKSNAEVLAAMAAGRLILLFDGYDEVALANGQLTRNIAFSQEVFTALSASVSATHQRPSVVFLFRTVFQHHGVFAPLDRLSSRLVVEFFAQQARRHFLSSYLRQKCGAKPALASLADAFLEAFERHMAPAQAEAAAFFGHAVVLSAFGDYLAESEMANAQALANALARSKVDDAFVDGILGKIIEAILKRETDKFPDHEYRSLVPAFEGYTVDVQTRLVQAIAAAPRSYSQQETAIESLISEATQQALERHPEYGVLDLDRQRELARHYQEELRRRIQHHPFLDMAHDGQLHFRNPIYEEFFLARAVSTRSLSMSEALELSPHSSHFLALFLLASLPDRDFSKLGEDALFHTFSLLNGAASSADYRLELELEDGVWEGRFEGRDLSIAPITYTNELLTFAVPNEAVIQNLDVYGGADSMILFRAPVGYRSPEANLRVRLSTLRSNTVAFDCVLVGLESCEIECSELSFEDRVLEIEGLDTLVLRPQGEFNLTASGHVKRRWGPEIDRRIVSYRPDAAAVLGLLESVLLWFRKHGRVSYGVYEKRFDTVILRKGRDVKIGKFVKILFDMSILSKSGDLIELNQKALESLGVFYRQQNALECRDTALLEPLVHAWAIATS